MKTKYVVMLIFDICKPKMNFIAMFILLQYDVYSAV